MCVRVYSFDNGVGAPPPAPPTTYVRTGRACLSAFACVRLSGCLLLVCLFFLYVDKCLDNDIDPPTHP